MFDKLTIILLIAMALGSVGGYLLVSKLRSDLEAAELRTQTLEDAAAENEATIARLQLESEKQFQLLTDLNNNLQNAEQYNRELRKLLADHDLTFLAEEKPGLIEKRMNDATEDVFNSIEQFTRSR